MEQLLLEFGLKDGIFVGLFVWLLVYVLKTSKQRESELQSFLNGMRVEFAKLVGSYESLSKDVSEIREELKDVKRKDNN